MQVWSWFLDFTGVTNPIWYNWWSGVVGDFGLLSIFALAYRKLNCHVAGCPRIGLHRVGDGKYIVCKVHHPDMGKGHRTTMAHIMKEHIKFQQKNSAGKADPVSSHTPKRP